MPIQHPSPEDVALSLALAVVAASPTPLLLLDGDLRIVAASQSFGEAFDAPLTDLAGQQLPALGAGEWNAPDLRELLTLALSTDAWAGPREMDLKRAQRPTRRLIVQARRLAYLDLSQSRILVAVSDVTDARADAASKESALRQVNVLLQEVRHRVANSLQVIASVLLRNARVTESEETRGHLNDAHNRVMSVAALERLLSTSEDGDVEARAYFTHICDSITASMIGESGQVSLSVEGGEAMVNARVSMSLGLIVTELVINALKYAFPDGRPGRIRVDYDFHGPNWTLCVRDDGVGMAPGRAEARTGLGTGIVQALARQLNASVDVVPDHPGTKVSIRHAQIALVQDDPETASEPLASAHPSSNTGSGS